MLLADLATTTNLYIVKSANVLDRSLRAAGTAAQKNAMEKIREYSSPGCLGEHSKGDLFKNTIIEWAPEQLRIVGTKEIEQITKEADKAKEGITWELTHKEGIRLEKYDLKTAYTMHRRTRSRTR